MKKTNDDAALSPAQGKLRDSILSPWRFWWYMLMNVPAGCIAGMRLLSLDSQQATTSIPYKFLNKNPFRSIYFAVQSMAAELSTAALVLLHIQGQSPSIAFIIVDLKASFPKKAIGKTIFSCPDGNKVKEAVEKCIATGEALTVDLNTIGKLKDGTVVADFTFRWSMKARSK